MRLAKQNILVASLLLVSTWAITPCLAGGGSSSKLSHPNRASTDLPEIDTNRPSFLNSPTVVPTGSIQFENGTTFQGYRGKTWVFDIPETQIRYGLHKDLEFQMSVPNYVLLHYPGLNLPRASNISEAGFKVNLVPDGVKWDIGIIASVNIPTGSRIITGSGVQPVIKIPLIYDINKKWSLGTMQSLLVLNKGRDIEWDPDFIVTRTINHKAAVFMEYGGFFTQQNFPVNIMHFGGTYKVKPTQQLDMHFGFGMNKAAPSAFVGVGYSFRIGGHR